jgi:hypothetical protein
MNATAIATADETHLMCCAPAGKNDQSNVMAGPVWIS